MAEDPDKDKKQKTSKKKTTVKRSKKSQESSATSITDSASFQAWLENKPDDWVRQMAVRVSLRVAPFIFDVLASQEQLLTTDDELTLILVTFRANFLANALVVNVDSSGKIREAVNAAASTAVNAAASTAVNAAIWESINFDAQWLEGHNSQLDTMLIDQPLWLNDVRGRPSWEDDERETEYYISNIPPWIREPLDAFSDSVFVRENPHWHLWVDWYRALIPNNSDNIVTSAFGAEADLAIAQLPASFWGDDVEGRTPDAVMIDLAKIVEEHRNSDFNAVKSPIIDTVDHLIPDTATADDQLNRAPFAHALVDRLTSVHEENCAARAQGKEVSDGYAMHLHAPWGAGKSSILKMMWARMDPGRPAKVEELNVTSVNLWAFLDRQLFSVVRALGGLCLYVFQEFFTWTKKDRGNAADAWCDDWIIVDFNAWEHQRRKLPWWPMIDDMRHSVLEKFDRDGQDDTLKNDARKSALRAARRIRVEWFCWKLISDWLPVSLAVTVGLAVLALSNSFLEGVAKNITVLTGAFGAFILAGRALVFGGKENATFYHDLSNDPLKRISDIFRRLVWMAERPICIFIDDLDRCSADYVVTLLEGIQTSFREKNVFYVVAADRAWIRSSFKQRYHKFADHVGSDTQPIGYLFLEKLFQVSTPIPGTSHHARAEFWNGLIGHSADDGQGDASDEVTPIALVTQDDIDARAKQFEEQNPDGVTGDQARVTLEANTSALDRAAMVQLLNRSSRAEKERQHLLAQYHDLLPDNPRFMKRMINAFALRQTINLLENSGMSSDALARWTILEQQFPAVADLLNENPAWLSHLGRGYDEQKRRLLPRALWLFNDDTQLRKTIDGTIARKNGEGNLPKLTVAIVEAITGIERYRVPGFDLIDPVEDKET